MKGKIVFEEHIAIEETLGRAKAFAGDSGHWEDFSKSILDIGEQRIELMDKNGIDFSIPYYILTKISIVGKET